MAATRPGSQQRHADKRRSAQERPAASLALHPSSALVPAMSAAAFTQLRADIERRGIQTPLDITKGGILLDGRSRLRAARELGQAQVPVRIIAPADEVEYMVRAAIERRHLTASQLAALLVEWNKFAELREIYFVDEVGQKRVTRAARDAAALAQEWQIPHEPARRCQR